MSPETHRHEAELHAWALLQIQRWHRLGLLDDATRAALARYERCQVEELLEPAAAAAAHPEPTPTPAPRARPAVAPPAAALPVAAPHTSPTPEAPPPQPKIAPLPLPEAPEAQAGHTLEVMGHFLRERVWWLVGAGLTVIGSFFVAGTVWGDLSGAVRLLVLLCGMGLYALAFARLGHALCGRAGGERAGHWLLGVSVALGPVLAMTAGSGWSLGGAAAPAFTLPALAAVAGLLAWRLPRDLRPLLPGADAALLTLFGALALSVGLLPLAPGPSWLLVPAGLAVAALWWAGTRVRRLPTVALMLVGEPLALHLYLAPHGPPWAYAPSVALAALALLYLDILLGRWRGVPALGLRGLRGVGALTLALLALALLLPSFSPLPSGADSSLCGLLLVPFFFGAALAWRRPALVLGSMLAALVFTLALPDLFWAAIEPFIGVVRVALGYRSEPLPLAWYSLTLLPYLLAARLAETGLRRSGWRQAEALATHAWRWTLGLSLLLVVLAHTRADDLRPALLALPVHAALWLRERRVRALLGGTLPWLALLAWTVDLLGFLHAGPQVRLLVGGGLAMALIPTGRRLAALLREQALLEGARLVAVPAALALPVVLRGWDAPALALALAGTGLWVTMLGLRAPRIPPTWIQADLESVLAWLALGLLVAAALVWAVPRDPTPLAWAAGLAAGAVLCAVPAWLLPRRRVGADGPALALEVAAHALAAAAILPLLALDGLPRLAMKLPLAMLLAWWLARRHWKVYGTILTLGLCESVVRRVGEAGWLEPGSLAVLAAAVCWLPALALALWRVRVPSARGHWLHAALGLPSAWLGALSALLATVLLVIPAEPAIEIPLAALALVGMTLTAAALDRHHKAWFEAGAWAAALLLAARWALADTGGFAGLWLLVLAPGFAALQALRPSPLRAALAPIALAAALLAAASRGLVDGLEPLAAATLTAALLAWRQPRGWAELSLLLALVLGLASLERFVPPGLEGHLAVLLAAAALLRGCARWTPAARVGRPLAAIAAALWALDCAWLASRGELGASPLGLFGAVGLLLAWDLSVPARLLAPWAASAALLTLGAVSWLHPLVWLACAALGWTLSPREPTDRLVTWALATLSAAGLAWATATAPEARPVLALAWAGLGLLLAHGGRAAPWAWAGLLLGLLCAAAEPSVAPLMVVTRAGLALALVAWAEDTRRQALAALGLVLLGLATGAWSLAIVALAAVAARRVRPGEVAHLLVEPLAWALLAGAVAVRFAGGAGLAEVALLTLAVPMLGAPQPRLLLASLPVLACLPGEIAAFDPTWAWPAVLCALGLALALDRARPLARHGADLALGLAGIAALATLALHGATAFALLGAGLAAGWWTRERRELALAWLLIAGLVWSWTALGAWTALPALWALAAVLAAERIRSGWLRALALPLLVATCLLEGRSDLELDPAAWQRTVMGLVFALSVVRTLRVGEAVRWGGSLAWGAAWLLVLLVFGPLDRLPTSAWLPLGVGLGIALEGAALTLERRHGAAFVAPLRQATVALAVLALGAALLAASVTTLGVALAGCLFGLRYVLRTRTADLLVGLVLLDVAAILGVLDLGWHDPVAFVGPVGLSLLVLAQILRQSLDPRLRDLLRYAGALAVYLTAFGQAVFDPAWTLGLVLLGLAGLALGSGLRVRAFLTLGSSAILAALLTEVLRFGLNHSRFWAFYLTTLGLLILAGMVALTLLRPQLATLRGEWRERLEGWE